ncbi:hypothetical protein VaNZ11_016300 [Volvox africanus]|uniref:Peptidase M11 gametolysin domain-containing protein n=1 Tax=Volvox africanus TaxID=51714 RepID=A0ABQ5SMH2_9CHLO|nr:hypothetical protein VaNZ11_016300 [Volvox africanus]
MSQFNYDLFVLPKNFGAICGWVGLADSPGTRSWYSPDNVGILEQGKVMQELLRNFGLSSAWRNGVEYDDYSTAMGFGDSCPSAPELWRLGWATPLAQLNSSSFAANVYQTFALRATFLGPTGVMIKIQPDWMGPSAYKKNLYLALRVKAASDRLLLEEFNGKVSLHELDAEIDNSFFAFGDPKVALNSVISPNASVAFFNYQLHFMTGGRLPLHRVHRRRHEARHLLLRRHGRHLRQNHRLVLRRCHNHLHLHLAYLLRFRYHLPHLRGPDRCPLDPPHVRQSVYRLCHHRPSHAYHVRVLCHPYPHLHALHRQQVRSPPRRGNRLQSF